MKCADNVDRDLAQQDGWKTQDNEEKMLRETVHSHCYLTFFRHSVVLSLPAVLLRKVSNEPKEN